MQIQRAGVDEALRTLRTGRDGLTQDEATRRLTEFGANEVEHVAGVSLLHQFGAEFVHLFALILWSAAALAFTADALQPGQGMQRLGWAIVGVIVVNAIASFSQLYRAERTVESLRCLLPTQVTVVREGRSVSALTRELVPGDIVELESGDRVPADCRVLNAVDAQIDLSTLTGESYPRSIDPAAEAEDTLFQSRNVALAGTAVVRGRVRGVVFATGMRTEFGRIARLAQVSPEPPTTLQTELAHLSRVVAWLAIGLGIVFFALGQMLGLSIWANALFAIGIIVANVPEGLLPTVTLSAAMSAQRMARQNALVKHLSAVEALGATTVICTDKTGTLTENHMTAIKLHVAGEFWDLRGECPAAIASATGHLFDGAVACENVREARRDGVLLGDPMEVALVEMGRRHGRGDAPPVRVDEVPFDSDRKRMSTVNATREGRILYMKGAAETVLPRSVRQTTRQGDELLTARDVASIQTACDSMAASGLRVIAIAHRFLPPDCARDRFEEELVFDGLIGLEDPPRREVPDAIERCRAAGIKVVMITGDHPQTAEAIGRQIGLVRSSAPTVITGQQLSRLSDIQLQLALDADEILFARVAADQKLRIVQALQRKDALVAVTGDGVNDAPALKAADTGIAMGVTGTDVAKDAADIVLMDDNFASLVSGVAEGRGAFDNVRKFLTYILTSNIPELVPFLLFVLAGIPLPLTIMQILAVDLGTDLVPAVALGAEPPERDVMTKPPRPRDTRLVDRALLARAYVFLGGFEAAAALAAFFFVLHGGGWRWSDGLRVDDLLYRQSTTACLTAIVLMQVFNVVLCRSDHAPLIGSTAPRNPLILVGVAGELVLIALIVYSPWGHAVFGTAPLAAMPWLVVLPFALLMVTAEEFRKWLVRRLRLTSRGVPSRADSTGVTASQSISPSTPRR